MVELLLKFEENPKVLEYEFDTKNVVIWPCIRYIVFSRAISKLKDQNMEMKETKSRTSLNKQIFEFIKSIFIFNKKLDGSEILFLYDSISNIKIEDDIYFNRLFDYYAGVFESNTVMVESCNTSGYLKPRWFKKIHYFQREINIRRVKVRIAKVNPKDALKIEEFLEYLKINFPVNLNNDDMAFFRKKMGNIAKSLKYIEKDYVNLFKQYNPKIIFVEDALYGGYSAYIIKIAKEMGIRTAEFQHGMINKQHIAYSYSEALCKSAEYKKYTPDYLLTMGQYWSDNCQVPSEKIVIGMPHLFYNVEHFQKKEQKNQESKKNILFIGANKDSEMMEYVEYLAQSELLNANIIFKVHPLYVKNKEAYIKLGKYSNVKVIYDGNTFEYVSGAEWVVGDISTVLYESVAFGKKIAIIENEDSLFYTPRDLGFWVKTPKELLELMSNEKNEKFKFDYNFWEQNWKENYINFMNKI